MKCSAATAKLLLTICLATILNKASGCELSWYRYGDHCYRIYQGTFEIRQAKNVCKMEGGYLISITDISELDFLTQHTDQYPHSKFWVGLKKKDVKLMWDDGTEYVSNQTWVKFPDGYEHISEEVDPDGCFVLKGKLVGKDSCERFLPFICEHHISNKSDSPNCLIGSLSENSFRGEITGNCLFKDRRPTRKELAEYKCNQYNSHFVDFDDMMKDGLSAFYNHKVLSDDGSKFWTNFTWNGTNLIRSNGELVSEEYPIPVVQSSGTCITVQFNFTDLLSTKFHQTECDDIAFVVCSLNSVDLHNSYTTTRRSVAYVLSDDEDNCPEGYNWKPDRQRNYCYWETSFETDQLSWDDAEKYCQGYEGHVTSFHSVEEEKIGLSFQYGSLSHDYWIGLYFDADNETYKWTDGSPLDYENWAPGHPDHKDKRLRCVSMNAQEKHWTSSLCGILSWFICKVSKKSSHPMPRLPTPTPLESCDRNPLVTKSWYFGGSCYFPVTHSLSWHRAKQFCENQGSNLVSIHSTEEIGFLLRVLHDSSMETNRVWIGLNSFGSDGNFQWTDWTAVDFTYYASNEPNNFKNQEKCCNMNTRDGQWYDENCNAALGFICKRINDTSVSTVIPTTQDPRIGNCKKGWIAHLDRCYYVGGKNEKERLNWTEATDYCQKNGGYLTSIREASEQNFLAYLLQTLNEDAWIGLHDTIQSGRYYWLDNSDLQYTNWAPGEPSIFGLAEDCVKMVFNHLDSGVWKDDECNRKIGFICQTNKDPQLPPPPSERGMNCVQPEGWLKLDSMCYKMFDGNPLNWYDAELACKKEGGHLVSVSDQKVKAIVTYLATEVNQPFFIGLQYDKDSQSIKWLNNFPIRLSNWEKNEPRFMAEGTCFVSTSEGYWKKASCDEKMPYLCQITTGKPKKLNKFVGECPTTGSWSSGSNSYCYILQKIFHYDWFTANIMCFRFGSHLISIHSMEEIEDIKKIIEPGVQSVYLGLMRNKKGGFTWTDDTPVNFVNWDEGEPSNSEDQCVHMMTHNMKWRVTRCLSKKNFVCMDTKGTLYIEDIEAAKYDAEHQGLSPAVICAIVFGILVVVVLVVAAVLYRKRNYRMPQFRRQDRNSSVSFENALYDVNSSSMVFNEENKS